MRRYMSDRGWDRTLAPPRASLAPLQQNKGQGRAALYLLNIARLDGE